MGKITEALRSFTRARNVPIATSAPWWRSYALPRERDYLRDVGNGAGSNLVVPAIDFIANGFIEAPVKVSEQAGDEWEAIRDHPMSQFIARPNPFYSGTLLWMPTIADWIGDGNAYWIITSFSGAARPAEMYWIPQWLIEPKGPDDGSTLIDHYEYRPNGRQINLDPQQVVHFRWGLDPENPRKGFSRLKSVLREIYSDEEAARFTAALLRNMGVPGLVMSPTGDGTIPFEEAQATKLDIMQKTTGDHRGEPLVMTTATNTEQYGFSPEQMDLSRLRSIPESRVAAALGIPASVIGFLSGMEQTKVGASMAEQRELAYEQGIIPKMRLFTEELHTQLLTHYTGMPERFKVEFDLSDVRVLQEDESALVTRIDTRIRGGWMTIAAGKQAVGEVPDPGDDIYLRSSSVTEVGPDAQPALPPSNIAQLPRVAASRTFAVMKRATKGQLAYLRQVERDGQRLTPGFAGELGRAFDDLGQRAAAAWDQIPRRFVADPIDETSVEAIIAALALEDWRNAVLEPLWRTHYLRTANVTYSALHGHLDLGIGTDIPDYVARQVVAAGGRQLGLVDLDNQARSALFEALTVTREEGLGPIEAARRIRRYVGAGRFTGMEAEKAGSGVRYRSELIARTETLHAQRVSVAEAGRAAGYSHYLAFDNRTGFGDEECVPAGTEIAALDPEITFTRWFEGDLVEIQTADGQLLSATANHPILAPHGWIPAGEIKEGDQVVRCTVADGGDRRPHDSDVPASAEQCFDLPQIPELVGAVGESIAARHLDGKRFDRQIDAVASERPLGNGRLSALLQQSPQRFFVGPAELAVALTTKSAEGEFALGADGAFCGGVGGVSASPSLGGRQASGGDYPRGARRSELESGTDERITNVGSGHAEAPRHILGMQSAVICPPDAINSERFARASTALAPRHTVLPEDLQNGRLANAEGGRELYRSLAGDVALSEVLSVKLKPFVGHVYNLQTREGWYVANGIVTHNCLARDGQTYTYEEMLAETANEHPGGTLGFAPVADADVAIAAARGRVTEIQHVDYDDATGRIAKTWKEEVNVG